MLKKQEEDEEKVKTREEAFKKQAEEEVVKTPIEEVLKWQEEVKRHEAEKSYEESLEAEGEGGS